MGTYIYGVTSKSRKIKGFDTPVYNVKFLGKPWSGWHSQGRDRLELICEAYDRKEPMTGELVAYDIFADGESQPAEDYAIVYRYERGYNTFSDGGDMDFMVIEGYAMKVGNRYQRISKAEYEAEMRRQEEESRLNTALFLRA